MHYTLTWVPDPNQPKGSDPPPANVTVIVTLNHRQSVGGNTGSVPAQIAATATLAGDGISFPDITGSASGTMAMFSNDSGTQDHPYWDTKKIHLLSVANGQATLDVPLSATTAASYYLLSMSMLAPWMNGSADKQDWSHSGHQWR